PNFVRMEIGSGVLWSDGETIRAVILDDARACRRLELPAPLLVASIKELYPDSELAKAMDLRVSPNVFWAPPQAILTLAQDPLRTLVPEGARTRLLRPEYLRFVDPSTGAETLVACDRVEIDGEGGVRVLWLDRETKGLVRFDFPLEQVAVPQEVDRVAELRLEFPNQILSAVAPTDLSRFREPPRRPNEPNVSLRPETDALSSPLEPTVPSVPNAQTGENVKSLSVPQTAETAQNAASSQTAETAETRAVRVVDRFLPPELLALGRPFPPVRARALGSGFSDATLGGPRDDGKKTLVCFWGSSTADAPNVGSLSGSALREFEQVARYNADEARLAFLAVNFDPAEKSDDAVRAEYGAKGGTAPLFRLDRAAMREFDFPPPAVPSFALVNERGIVQKYVREPISFVALQRLLVRALDGGDLYNDDFNAHYAAVKRFVESLEAADANDRYRVASERREPTPASIPPRRYPKTFELREIWRFDELYAPTNPLAVSASDPDFDAAQAFERLPDDGETAPDADDAPTPSDENNENNENNALADDDVSPPPPSNAPLSPTP
ncbi:MAG: hypothetical protein IJ991_14975, partial [Thermoguttaceae bacterium]|nr:hypothetical protein [Thermoguttaceae bacterium]